MTTINAFLMPRYQHIDDDWLEKQREERVKKVTGNVIGFVQTIYFAVCAGDTVTLTAPASLSIDHVIHFVGDLHLMRNAISQKGLIAFTSVCSTTLRIAHLAATIFWFQHAYKLNQAANIIAHVGYLHLCIKQKDLGGVATHLSCLGISSLLFACEFSPIPLSAVAKVTGELTHVAIYAIRRFQSGEYMPSSTLAAYFGIRLYNTRKLFS